MRPSSSAQPVTARDVIAEIVRNMKEGLEPLLYSTLAPSLYTVYLHADDLDRLRGILPRIVEEARAALDAELEVLNRPSLPERMHLARKAAPPVALPEGGWRISILENTEEDAVAGDVVVHSELALPDNSELGTGSATRRIATRRLEAATVRTSPAATSGTEPVLATLEYEDNGGPKTFSVTKDQIVIGRGGQDFWTDLKLDTLPDVSRTHCRIRRDPVTGQFFLKDLSSLGTTIDGQPVPPGIEHSGQTRRELDLEAPLPAQARIGLAGVLFLEFRATAR
jgi:hypothetical protein